MPKIYYTRFPVTSP